MHYGRIVNKLYKPEQFSVKEIIHFSQLIDVSPTIIGNVILGNAEENMNAEKNLARRSKALFAWMSVLATILGCSIAFHIKLRA